MSLMCDRISVHGR